MRKRGALLLLLLVPLMLWGQDAERVMSTARDTKRDTERAMSTAKDTKRDTDLDTVRVMSMAAEAERETVSETVYAMEDTEELKKTPDSLTRVEIRTIRYYTDTLTEIAYTADSTAKQREEVIRVDSTDRRGHYIQAHVGVSYGSLGYGFEDEDSKVSGFVSPLIQLQYAYFFHKNWGVGAGLWYTYSSSTAHVGGTYEWKDVVDTDLEQHYTHTSTVFEWDERQWMHHLAIPISLQFQWLHESGKAGVFAAVGLAPSFTVANSYSVKKGTVNHSGYYPAWDLTLRNVHEFGDKDYTQEQSSTGKLSVSPTATVFADIAALVPLTKQIDLIAGLYFQCGANDANTSEKKALGWKDETFTFMEDYDGAYALNTTKASHPFEVGVKVGIHWHYIGKDKHNIIDYFEYYTRIDTTVSLLARQDTVIQERIDTLTRAHIAKAAQEVEKFNKIYFAYDSYKLTDEVENYLSSIVGVLNSVPDAKISIDGHASEEGQRLHNERLAYNRAKAVAKYLVQQGIDKERVIVIGHGSLVPNEENVNHELSMDRRAEVKVVQKQSEIEPNK
ncbi:MAG: OmpA family protein [Paludibacteraceae bacterium]|nr:OmpA family protein [Paludibacteraceae bacterium]